MLLREHERPPARLQPRGVAGQNHVAGVTRLHRQMTSRNREAHAGRQADQIVGVGQPLRLIKIVDAPDQAPLTVAPGAEIFDMQVANCQHRWRLRQSGADAWPLLGPAIEGRAEKRKDRIGHLGVFVGEVVRYEREVLT